MQFFNRYTFGFLFALALAILVFVLLISSGTPSSTTRRAPPPITAYENAHTAVMVDTFGPIVADQNHNETNITVTQANASLTTYQGYNKSVITYKSYSNSPRGYNEFLHALYYAGFDLGDKRPKISSSSGLCAIGSIYTYTLVNDNKVVHSYWVTTCDGDPKTYLGNQFSTNSLFQAQIPDYSTLVQNLNI